MKINTKCCGCKSQLTVGMLKDGMYKCPYCGIITPLYNAVPVQLEKTENKNLGERK